MSKHKIKIIALLLNDLSRAYYNSNAKQLTAVNKRVTLYEQLFSITRIMADTTGFLNEIATNLNALIK